MKCPYCSSEIDYERVCPECNTPLQAAEQASITEGIKNCGICDQKIALGAMLCRFCGSTQITTTVAKRGEIREKSSLVSGITPIASDNYTSTRPQESNKQKSEPEQLKQCHIALFQNKDKKILCSISQGTFGSTFARKPIVEELKFSYKKVEDKFGDLVNRITSISDNEGKNVFGEIEKFGKILAQEVFTKNIVNIFESIEKETSISFFIDEDLARIPWELVDLGLKGGILLRNPIGRIILSDELSSKIRRESDDEFRILIVIGPDNIQGNQVEKTAPYWDITLKLSDMLTQLFREKNAMVTVLEYPNVTKGKILTELEKGIYDVVHFLGHGFIGEIDGEVKTGLIGIDDQNLEVINLITAQDINQALTNAPETPFLFFAHACSIGQHMKSDFKDTQSVGLAATLIRNNVNFIGAHWNVTENGSDIFARTLYRELLVNPSQPLGNLVLKARNEVLQSRNREDPNFEWLAFTLNGDPMARINFSG
ncbi:MAG: C25 family cysteine peptidase [Candidatus Kariarchaeaceae archaeon]|jgi:hypothetical protein